MLNKILIANRGEIACRVIRTARHWGIGTVAVYSEADRDALHVISADQAVCIGAAPARDSYLCIEKIIAAARQTGAEAIHPGYGFLSENAAFAAACETAGLVFIGPPVAAIEAMGSKSRAKRLMQEAGVPVVPGYHGQDQSAAAFTQAAEDMGYPVLLKAVAGGGGKGMRQVLSADELPAAIAAAQREAKASFGDDTLLLEKLLIKPRHIEIQLFCDTQGNGVYLFERDCSAQRRHQKIVEEAPAPGVSEALRKAMGQAALKAAQAIGYRGAGTIEFLLDTASGDFYFMEMNTRLQVEHPVTEMITGEDLVAWQLRIAAGESLPCTQAQLSCQGHAIEVRIYAEDPDNGFLPATGSLRYLSMPPQDAHLRIDTGVQQGDSISHYYDPMIAKLIVWGHDRPAALRRLRRALAQCHIAGLTTNIPFLQRLAANEDFAKGPIDTGFVEVNHPALTQVAAAPDEDNERQSLALAGIYLALKTRQSAVKDPSPSPWAAGDAWRLSGAGSYRFDVLWRDAPRVLTLMRQPGQGDTFCLVLQDATVAVQGSLKGNRLVAFIGQQRITAEVADDGCHIDIFSQAGAVHICRTVPAWQQDDKQDDGFAAPINGTIIALLAEPGAAVAAGEPLVIMEAMKMEYSVKAPQAGTLLEYRCAEGDLVQAGQTLLVFSAAVEAPDDVPA